ncbi:hypothetical protein [Achromobacter denitrificans]|uniref:hypothetical protein n=1 Tax=Achromobacter denitrificans TaxID=32002 RepID=UPI0012FAA58C|nr:hypothetical protein [Achromobacter denitrificans]
MPLPGVPTKQYLFVSGGSFDVHPQYWKLGTNQYRAKVRIREHLHRGGAPVMATYHRSDGQIYATKRNALVAARALKKVWIAHLRTQRR